MDGDRVEQLLLPLFLQLQVWVRRSCLFARSLAESRAASIPKSPTAHLQYHHYHYRPTNAAWFPPSISSFEAEDGEWSLPLIGIRFVDFSRADGPQVSQASRDILVPPSHTVSLKPSLTTLRPSEPLLFSSNARWLQLSSTIWNNQLLSVHLVIESNR